MTDHSPVLEQALQKKLAELILLHVPTPPLSKTMHIKTDHRLTAVYSTKDLDAINNN